jgi:hypothetical protein
MMCPACTSNLNEGEELCRHHGLAVDDAWAATNRLMCGFFHRHGDLPRVSQEELSIDDFGSF